MSECERLADAVKVVIGAMAKDGMAVMGVPTNYSVPAEALDNLRLAWLGYQEKQEGVS